MDRNRTTVSVQERNNSFAIAFSFIFFLVALVGVLNHEMWSDELMFWMMARDNHSLGDLIRTLRFEYMHPWLWGILLYGISRFTREPLAMQVFHIAIATASIFLLVRFAPFTRLQKVLLSFGYFFLYEYSVISRNYGLGVLVIFLFCVLFPSRRQSYLPLGGVLAVMVNVNFYSRMTAIALVAMLLLELWRDKILIKRAFQRKGELTASALIVMAGLLLSVIQNIPPDRGGGSLGLLSNGLTLKQVASAIANLWRAYFPIPGLSLRFWNSNILDDGTAALLSWIPLGFSIALFRHRPLILFLYLFNLAEVLLFHILWTGLVRHLGIIFILFIVCLWLSNEYPAEPIPARSKFRLPGFFDRYQAQFLSVVLVVQVVAGVYAYTLDLVNPFSAARAVAQFIRSQPGEPRLVAGAIDVFTQSVSGHLDQPIFYPERDRLGTYISSDQRALRPTSQQLVEVITKVPGGDNSLLILNKPLNPVPKIPNWSLTEIAQFQNAIVRVENYSLYSLRRNP
ncbi:hypothetical protein JOY44_17870 [Phormidium sp. CLA17]|uniref:hypothetical protein n=1 Tax=Leptolyngbya sp. Cla-17 TaxID=2803751 RepID=UPI001491AD55|nr:hypothetical protein [Leptolyngbya sp. Cla-17]MBM0743455.1 hypothetical protein [Leptolyngbya sp. Cla-17]